MLFDWLKAFDIDELPKDSIYQKLDQLAATSSNKGQSSLVIHPLLFGERHCPDTTGSVSGIIPTNLDLGHVTLQLYKGVLENLFDMMPLTFLHQFGVQRIVGSGSVLTKSRIIRDLIEQISKLPLFVGNEGDAAYGAALASGRKH